MELLIVIACMLSGILIGYVSRKKPFRHASQVLTVLIWLLLFLLGISIGSNSQVMRGLGSLGLEALLISVSATLGSAIAAGILWHVVQRGKRKV